MTTGTGAIWRDNNAEDSASSGNIIEFEGLDPDALTKLGETEITVHAGLAFLKKPKGIINQIQDTFTKGVSYTIVGYVTNPKTAQAQNDMKVWAMQPKTVITTFPFGRFGIRLDDFPDFNVRPKATRGLMMGDIKWTNVADTKFKAAFTVDLFFYSNVAGLDKETYNWNQA